MIRVKKLSENDAVHGRAIRALEARRKELARAGEARRQALYKTYAKMGVKAALIAETSGKCAYCESQVEHVDWGEAEHVEPKCLALLERALAYANLVLACKRCNVNKGTTAGVIDPTKSAPEDHMHFFGPELFEDDDAGELTINALQLNREELFARRTEALRAFADAHRLYRQAKQPVNQAKYKESLRHMLAWETEYVLMKRQFLLAADRNLAADRKLAPIIAETKRDFER